MTEHVEMTLTFAGEVDAKMAMDHLVNLSYLVNSCMEVMDFVSAELGEIAGCSPKLPHLASILELGARGASDIVRTEIATLGKFEAALRGAETRHAAEDDLENRIVGIISRACDEAGHDQ